MYAYTFKPVTRDQCASGVLATHLHVVNMERALTWFNCMASTRNPRWSVIATVDTVATFAKLKFRVII